MRFALKDASTGLSAPYRQTQAGADLGAHHDVVLGVASRPVERRANWPAAEVAATEEGFILAVPIEGDPDPDWDDAFRRAVERRRLEIWSGQWGHVRHRPDQVVVEQVTEGSEKPLQDFLDACIQKAEEGMRRERADRKEDEAALELRRTEASSAPRTDTRTQSRGCAAHD